MYNKNSRSSKYPHIGKTSAATTSYTQSCYKKSGKREEQK